MPSTFRTPPPITRRLRLEIHGAVQGVGFRPFVYRLATGLGLAGWVINDSRGVFIEVEGLEADVQAFLARLPVERPPLSLIQSLDATWLEPTGDMRFEIRHSDNSGVKTVLVLPDIAACPDCLAETLDPTDRRHRYPFTNCTNCGPRFSIIEALPYDRPHTTMRRFLMCPACQSEYEDPADRRFHAQPNACPTCGPSLAFFDFGWRVADGESNSPLPVTNHQPPLATGHEALRAAAEALLAGRIIAVKGLGGFHLMVDACNEAAVARLRQRKPRRHKPFAIMARDLTQARTLVETSPQAEALLASPEAPIVLLPKTDPGRLPIAQEVAPGNPNLGVMLPATPLHHLLLAELGLPIVATSGNLTDEPICTDEREAVQRLGRIADAFLVHDRPIARHVDDSVAWLVDGEPRLLRRARGYAPLPLFLRQPVPTILAVGAHLKNSVALSIGQQVFISQHIGDLETAEALFAFERVIADFLRLYDAQPVAIAHDLHPEYLSTQWARGAISQGSEVGGQNAGLRPLVASLCPLIPVQHHHAHLASVLAENHALGPALGVIWDGAGYGTDGAIWGGEFLLGDAAGYTRVAHLRPFLLPGGDAAIKEPRRLAVALLWEMFGDDAFARDDLAPVAALSPAERRLLGQMLRQQVNTPVTTSMGRLFDGVAALLDLHQTITFEGQAAMALEFIAAAGVGDAYPFSLHRKSDEETGGQENDGCLEFGTLDWRPLLEAILADLDRRVPISTIAARFHNALGAAVVEAALAIGCPRVALSGGCFQNRRLVETAVLDLRRAGFEVILHRQVPPNDGGISLGQIAIAAAALHRNEVRSDG